jgi:iron complex outermembrane receptor protein
MNMTDPRNLVATECPSGLLAALRKYPARLVLALGITSAAFAQTAEPTPAATTTTTTATTTTVSTTPAAPADEPVTMGAYQVNGYASSLAASLQAKRSSEDNVEVISAEDVGKFPDLNLAESLSHLPGVSVDYLFGEGERVSIEGTDPNLNRVLLNGEPVSTADWYVLDNQSRQFNYLLISPDLVSQAEVYKTWEPKLLEGSLGATVMVDTRNPLDMPNPLVFTGTITDDYNERNKKSEGSETAMLSWHNDAKTFGIMVGGEDNRDYLRRDGVESLALDNNTNLGVAGPLPGQPAGPWVTAEVVNTAEFLQLRHHQGGNFAIDLKPSDNLTISLTGLYVKQTMDNVNFSWYIYPGDNWSGLPSISNATVTNGVLGSYTINTAPLVVDAFNRAAQIVTQQYNGKAVYKGDNFTLTTDAGFTRATGGTQHQFFAENFLFASAKINESQDSSAFQLTAVNGDPTMSGINNGADFGTIGAGDFYGNIASNPEVDTNKWIQLDLVVPFKGSALKNLQTGMRFSDEKAGENGLVESVPNAGAVNTNLSDIGVSAAPGNYLSGLPGITSSMADHVILNSYGGVANYVGNLPEGNGQTLLQYFNSAPPADGAVFTSTPSFTLDERINAAYVESSFGDGQITGNFGARFVDTTTTSASYNLSTPGAPTLQTSVSTYSNILPAVNINYDLAQDQILRFGVSEVIARPNTSAEANWVQLYDSTLGGVGGNGNLRPDESTNLDLAYENYFAKNSYLAVDFFYKDISNYIVNAANPEQWTDYSLAGHPTETYEITRPTNGGAASSEGATFSYQQYFAYGFGASANYSIIHTSSANGPLPFTSKNQINISPFYENKWGTIRVTYSWRDDYLSSSFNGQSAVWTAPYGRFDANASVNITKNISIILSVTNITDETYHQYFKTNGAGSVLADEYKDGADYSAALHWSF